jgi:peptidoglycan/xylan/chitin deacetylase (PgdA/CDA1 family)
MIDQPVVVLLYHRVNALFSDPHLLAVTPDNFRAQLNFLKQNFDIIRFGDVCCGLKRQSVAITFDDGYADNFFHALPVLEEMDVPATFFVSTGMVGSAQEFWWDELERIVLGNWSFTEKFELNDSRFGRIWNTKTAEDRRMLHAEIHLLMLKIDTARRDLWLRQLREWAGAGEKGREVNRSMTVGELQRLAGSRWVTVGAHTVSHTRLSVLPVADQQREIIGSKKQLESWLGREVTVFSYPFGRQSDYTKDTVNICKEAGFAGAAANFPGQAHRWTDPYQVPRQTVFNWTVARFSEEMERFQVT